MASPFFARAFEGDTMTPPDPWEALRAARPEQDDDEELDDLVGGMMPCDQCGEMVEFEMTMTEFGTRGVTCRDHD